MADDADYQPLFDTKFGVILIAMGSASFVVTIYHLIFICCKHASEQARQHEQPATQTPSTEEGSLVSHQIPSYKYEKKRNDDDDDDDDCVTCAVCLGDFEEGEELRAMPSCMHSFHVPCIDMWLLSHLNCPVCRADATPSPVVPHCLPEVRSTEGNVDYGVNMVQIVVTHDELQNGLHVVRS